jgi:hypothetical protein
VNPDGSMEHTPIRWWQRWKTRRRHESENHSQYSDMPLTDFGSLVGEPEIIQHAVHDITPGDDPDDTSTVFAIIDYHETAAGIVAIIACAVCGHVQMKLLATFVAGCPDCRFACFACGHLAPALPWAPQQPIEATEITPEYFRQ